MINNERYHPIKRLKALKKLCFSSHFALSIVWRGINATQKDAYIELRKLIMDFYYNFENFQSKWHLKDYSDLKNDIDLQHKLHEDFKILIHSLFTFGSMYINFDITSDERSVIDGTVRPNIINYKFDLHPKYTFIDIICPSTEDGLESLFEVIKQGNIDEDVVPVTTRPMFDRRFQATVEEQGWKDAGNPMIFDKYLNPYLLMYNMWNISYDD